MEVSPLEYRRFAPDGGGEGFGIDELFFSTTDAKGRIVTGNPVFARVSGYDPDELRGRAHNIVRHPDMPRVVFRILWEHLAVGRPVAAYVKNRAKDGRHYWVVATVSPIASGHLSVRFAPTGELFAVVRDVYAELVAVERSVESAGGTREDAITASAARLGELLGGLGLPDYDALMRRFLPAELRSREALLEGSAYWDGLWAPETAGAGEAALLDVLDAFRGVHVRMQRLFATLEDHVALNDALTSRSRDLTGDTRLLSLNALMAASHLGPDGATLAVVASLVGEEADRAGALTEELNRRADALNVQLEDLAFRIAVGRLQAEMAVFFGREMLRQGGAADEVVVLSDALADSMAAIRACGAGVSEGLGFVSAHMQRLAELLHVLSVLQLNGTIEAARTDDALAVRQLFGEMRERLDTARTEITELAAVADAARARAAAEDPADTDAALAAMRERARLLALAG